MARLDSLKTTRLRAKTSKGSSHAATLHSGQALHVPQGATNDRFILDPGP